MGPPKAHVQLSSPAIVPWALIPCPEYAETTDMFRTRALDSCLDTYLEHASWRLQRGRPLNEEETRHLVHHIKASGYFRTPRLIVWHTRPLEEQRESLSLAPAILTLIVDYNPPPETLPYWMVCREVVVADFRFFDLFALQEYAEQGLVLEGPNFDGPSDFEIYVIVEGYAGKRSLVSIGKWTHNYGGQLKDVLVGMEEVRQRVKCPTEVGEKGIVLAAKREGEELGMALADLQNEVVSDKAEVEDS